MRRAALVAITGAILCAACGGGGSDASTSATTHATGTGALATWAAKVCGNTSVWDEAMGRVRTVEVSPATPADVSKARDTLANALGDAATATDTLLAALRDVGAAPIKGGDNVSTPLIKAYRAARDAIATAQAGAKQLPVDSIEAYNAGRDALAATLAQAVGAASATLSSGPSLPAVDKAFQHAPGCAPTNPG